MDSIIFVKNEFHAEYSGNCDDRLIILRIISLWILFRQTNVTNCIKLENSGSITDHKNLNLTLKFDNSGENPISALCQDCNASSEKPCKHIDIFTSWTKKLVCSHLDSINIKDVTANRCKISNKEKLSPEAQQSLTSDFLKNYVEMSKYCGISNLLLKYSEDEAD